MTKTIPPPLPSGNPEKRNNGVQINDSKITYWFIPPEIGALQISLLQKNILGVVATFTRNGGECWATDVQFGEAFQWSRQKINAAINGMVAAGWLRKDVTRLSNGTTPRRLWLASPLIPLSPTVTSSTPIATDLVTHGDYPSHLGGLPLSPTVTTLVTHGDTNSNIIKKEKVIKEIVADAPTPTSEFSLILEEPQESEVPQESESLKEPIEISEAPPLPAPPPKAKKAVRPFEITDDERAKLLEYLREQAEARGFIPKLEQERLNLIIKETEKFWINKKKADWHRTVKNRIDQLFSWNRFSDWQAEAVGPSGLTITELNARLDYIFAWIHDTPVKPAVPFKDQADEDLATLVLISMFKENYEEVIKKKNIDDKKYYYKQFRELYEQAVKNERDREGRSTNIGSA